ncbi:MAG: sorbosone dehydrogenase family protein [Vulcanimicrobiaceae bacterium]
MTRSLGFGLAALLLLATVNGARAGPMPVVQPGFVLTQIGRVPGARELVMLPNGDLIVGTSGSEVYIIAHAEAQPRQPAVFVQIQDAPVAGVTYANGELFFGGQFGIYRTPYRAGDHTASSPPVKIASVRTSGISSDHVTTSVAFAHETLFASVGSSCDACDPELDATRATVLQMAADGSHRSIKAVHIRNAIALAVNPTTGTLWGGVAGQDELPRGHPFEIFDPITRHNGTPDYGWPFCYENRKTAKAGHDCSHAIQSRVVFPAYETPIGAAFYPAHPSGRYAFPREYWGAAFVTLHGSWHQPLIPPRVVFVPMHGDNPDSGVDWANPNSQWREFIGGFQLDNQQRIARPTGIAVGPEGDLFVAEDLGGALYRIRPKR